MLNATSMARTPMPIMIRRKVSIPLRRASSQTTSEVSTRRPSPPGDRRQVLAEEDHRHQHAAPGAGVKAHHVRAAERVTGQRLENGAADAERGADEQRH